MTTPLVVYGNLGDIRYQSSLRIYIIRAIRSILAYYVPFVRSITLCTGLEKGKIFSIKAVGLEGGI